MSANIKLTISQSQIVASFHLTKSVCEKISACFFFGWTWFEHLIWQKQISIQKMKNMVDLRWSVILIHPSKQDIIYASCQSSINESMIKNFSIFDAMIIVYVKHRRKMYSKENGLLKLVDRFSFMIVDSFNYLLFYQRTIGNLASQFRLSFLSFNLHFLSFDVSTNFAQP